MGCRGMNGCCSSNNFKKNGRFLCGTVSSNSFFRWISVLPCRCIRFTERVPTTSRNSLQGCPSAIGLVIVFLLLACLAAKPAYAILAGDEPLAEAEYDPTASLAQVQFRDIYAPAQYGTNAQQSAFQIRPIANISPFWLVPCEQLIRPTIRIVTAAHGKGASTSTGYDDMQLLDLFKMRWPDTDAIKFRWALGPFFIFPTATNQQLGQGAWQSGPAAAFSFRGIPGLDVAGLMQQATSYAYTSSQSRPITSMTFQPIVTYQLGRGWYLKSSDSTWTINLRHNSSTTIPINAGLGKLWQVSAGVAIDTSAGGEWMGYRQFAARAPQFSMLFQISLLFPKTQL